MKMSSSISTAAILGAGTAWLGLAAAAAGWRWTSQTLVGPAWDDAWLYTNLTLAMSLFVLFPMMLSSITVTSRDNRRICIFRHGLALLTAAVPMLITAAWLSHISVNMAINVSVLQIAFAIFSLGLCVWTLERGEIGRVLSLGAAACLFLLPPAIALIQAANFPWLVGGLWGHWITIFPAPMITAACHSPFPQVVVAWTAGVYAVAGIVLLASSRAGVSSQ